MTTTKRKTATAEPKVKAKPKAKAKPAAKSKRKATASSKPKRKKPLGETPGTAIVKAATNLPVKRRLKARPVDMASIWHKPAKSNAVLLTTLAVGAAGVLGYFGWQAIQKHKAAKNGNLDEALLQNSGGTIPSIPDYSGSSSSTRSSSSGSSRTTSSSTSSGSDWSKANTTDSDFPLKKGSKGAKVKALQQAIISKWGKSYMPKYGADGDFGSETVAALKKAGLPPTIDESTFNVLTQAGKADVSNLGKQLFDAAQAKNLAKVISLLKSISSKDEYNTVSSQFKQYRLNGGVRQTLVNGLLSAFPAESQKQQIRFEFLRMGLKYDGNKWSLDGFGGRRIVTTEPTTVWVSSAESLQVPAAMLLGEEVAQRLGYILFSNKARHFLVQSKSVKYL